MKFEWLPFLIEHRIEYVERGPNVKRGEINIQCPFCGIRDSSHHMGLDYRNAGWFACWRSRSHSGKNPAKLIKALLGCSWREAVKIAERSTKGAHGSVEELKAKLDGLDTPKRNQGPRRLREVKLPKEFFALSRIDQRSKWTGRTRFLTYIEGRGIKKAKAFATTYDLFGCLSGRFKHRLIFPVTFENKLIGWTGRAIVPAMAKYVSYPTSDESEAIDSVPWNYDRCKGGSVLIVTEGCFDASVAEWVGDGSVSALATLGINPSTRKVQLIRKRMLLYRRTLVVYDKEAEHRSVEVSRMLPGSIPRFVPGSIKDLGELSRKGLERLLIQEP